MRVKSIFLKTATLLCSALTRNFFAMKARALNILYRAFSSPYLMMALLAYSVVLLFFASVAQQQISAAQAQSMYFESLVFLLPFFGVKIPLAGGVLVGLLACFNIVLSCIRHSTFGLHGFGVSLAHMALVLLIVAGFMQYLMREEGRIVLQNGQSVSEVTLSDGSKVALPFNVRLEKFEMENWQGSNIAKNYSSQISFERDGKNISALVKMNSPVSFGGWTFYQNSYGENGKYSVLACVKNPARLLPWISFGAIFAGMLIIFSSKAFGLREREIS